jgi:hypothetical protein
MNRDGMSFAIGAEVEVRALRVHALVPDTGDDLLAGIAPRAMSLLWLSRAVEYEILLVLDLDKAMSRVLLWSDSIARGANVKVRAVHAFVAISNHLAFAKIADSRMMDRCGAANWGRRTSCSGVC